MVLSGPAGSRAIKNLGDSNIDMNDAMRPNGWPRSGETYGSRWLHGDWKDVAFFYNHRLYEDIVGKGGLK